MQLNPQYGNHERFVTCLNVEHIFRTPGCQSWVMLTKTRKTLTCTPVRLLCKKNTCLTKLTST